MNRYFIAGEERRDFPRQAFARIDDISPAIDSDTDYHFLSLDTVALDWRGFEAGYPFSRTSGVEDRVAQYWKSCFKSPPEAWDDDRRYDDVPLYQLEFQLPRELVQLFPLRDLTDWFLIELDDEGGLTVDVYGGLFAEPVTAYLSQISMVPPTLSRYLSLLFDMQLWPNADEETLEAALEPSCPIDQLAMFDIGQGSANALLCSCGLARIYFDVGCGVYRNKRTNPSTIQFCDCARPTVILSHWDSDHWSGAAIDRTMLRRHWIAPRQIIGPKHVAFANAILANGGRLSIFPTGVQQVTTGGACALELRRCKGPIADRNNSGLALLVHNYRLQRSWLLTGDAAYDQIPGHMPQDLAAIVVPHHGADMGSSSTPPAMPGGGAYARLLYSFGPGNAHGKTAVRHPTQAAVTAHSNAGWPHTGWTSPPGTSAPLVPVLATAEHPSTHAGGARAGWNAPPGSPPHLASCAKTMPLAQT